MFGRSNRSSTAESSFFYLLMAATCFRRRTGCARHPNAGSALRDIGREYLAKAGPDARVFTVGPR
jgi:hypothetical protein